MEPGPGPTTAIVLVNGKKPPLPSSMSKKKRGAMSILRAALFVWQRRSSRKRSKAAALQVEVATASAEMLNKVVGSMRPLHAKGGESPPHLAGLAAPAPDPAAEITLLLPSASPSRSEQFEDVASASDGSMSRYSSAVNLQELEKIERGYNPNDDEDNLVDGSDAHARDYDANAGDEMIDVKAEEFIARFYKQMRIQNQDEMARRSAYHSW